ncbi:MAG: hypothetical protein JNM96_05630 [Bacteroidia bacterium]|nr:hypothetical protein [Bacteroidia bacterium]
MRIIALIITLLIFSHSAMACQCPLTKLGKAECNKYEIIFRGKVISTVTCKDKPGEALFEIIDLYKGNAYPEFKILFDCKDPCNVGFNVGEEWIIYSSYKQIDNAMMDWCSRSRKFFAQPKEDFYSVTYGNSYDDEVKFLIDSLGLHRTLNPENKPNSNNRNELPTTNQSIIILICSLVSIIVFFYLINKYLK